MRKLSLIIGLLLAMPMMPLRLMADSPHGKDFKLSCDLCHSSDSWKFNKAIYAFDHNTTALPLQGQHQTVECRQCHKSLVFSDAKTGCVDCHTDMHNQTVGPDCQRCHTPKSWIVENITEMHQRSRFPLVGPHYTAECSRCHPSASLLRFEPQGVECYDCHAQNYLATTKPNHVQGGYSKNCQDCHSIFSMTWNSANMNHDFFPLTSGHAISDCGQCHINGNYTNISKECVSCHQANYNAAANPNHITAGFPTSCADCHTTTPGWRPANYTAHDAQFFPVYSGKHAGTWTLCSECHTTPGNLKLFSCIDCHAHNQNDMDSKHQQVGGYTFNSQACFECHPTGSVEGAFNHNNSKFPLTGAHLTTPCNLCHVNGFAGTPTDCFTCHVQQYNSTTNPNHTIAGIPTTCITCHTTNPGWKPATFLMHDAQYFPVYSGKHAGAWTVCADCHTTQNSYKTFSCIDCHTHNKATTDQQHASVGGYNYSSLFCYQCHPTGSVNGAFNHNNSGFPLTGAHITTPCSSCHANGFVGTPTACSACHIAAYNATTNPNHAAANIPTTCNTCHTTNPGWRPATYLQHDAQYFPVYSGKHAGTWTTCADCHTTANSFNTFSCIDCHTHNKTVTDQQHTSVGGYNYASLFCYECHPTGSVGGAFNHNNSSFPLTGAHITTPCLSCHTNGFAGTPTACSACHTPAYNGTTNPHHAAINIPTTCADCHTTNPGWTPATFPIHANYYALTGGHTTATCSQCHNGNYNTTPNTCVGCHLANYNSTTNPNHAANNIPTTCATCHTTNPGWAPANFPNHNNYFVIDGAHLTATCEQCHNGNYTNTLPSACVGCHLANYNSTTNPNHAANNIPTTCATCHTTNPGWAPAVFPQHNNYFVIDGAHLTLTCEQCHNGNYTNTLPSTCVGCHQTRYNQTTNPNHSAIGIPTTCAQCHTTAAWTPATFPIHSNYYVLAGAHTSLACATCHNGNYNNQIPTVCSGCHMADYNATTNPNHSAAGFPLDCASCHSQTAWIPSTFNHDGQYFPIYSGHHNGEWTLCSQCHQNPGNFAQFTCMSGSCHPQNSTNNEHQGVPGYSYTASACYSCHPTGSGGMSIKRPFDPKAPKE